MGGAEKWVPDLHKTQENRNLASPGAHGRACSIDGGFGDRSQHSDDRPEVAARGGVLVFDDTQEHANDTRVQVRKHELTSPSPVHQVVAADHEVVVIADMRIRLRHRHTARERLHAETQRYLPAAQSRPYPGARKREVASQVARRERGPSVQ